SLDGATNIRVQDLCPGRPVEHIQETYDAEVGAIVLDALRHPGPANPAREGTLACSQVAMAGVDPAEALRRSGETTIGLAERTSQNQVDAEPATTSYARP